MYTKPHNGRSPSDSGVYKVIGGRIKPSNIDQVDIEVPIRRNRGKDVMKSLDGDDDKIKIPTLLGNLSPKDKGLSKHSSKPRFHVEAN